MADLESVLGKNGERTEARSSDVLWMLLVIDGCPFVSGTKPIALAIMMRE